MSAWLSVCLLDFPVHLESFMGRFIVSCLSYYLVRIVDSRYPRVCMYMCVNLIQETTDPDSVTLPVRKPRGNAHAYF